MRTCSLHPKFFLWPIAILATGFVVGDWFSFHQCGAVEQCLVDSCYWQNFAKFSVTVLVALMTFFFGNRRMGVLDHRLLKAAMAVAVLADFCFKATLNIPCLGSYHEFFVLAGLSLFSVVQVLFIIRHTRENGSDFTFPKILYIPIFVAFFCASLRIVGAIEKTFILVGAAYGAFLVCSLIVALRIQKNGAYSTKNSRFVKYGMILFFCCDVCVGLSSATGPDYSTREVVASIAHNLTWIFYTPALVLLSLSGVRDNS